MPGERAVAWPSPARLWTLGEEAVRKAFSFPVALGALLVFICCMWSRTGMLDPDTWWHVKVGGEILASHQWPQADNFSFTVPGAPWIAYEWLGEALIALASRGHGLQGEALLLMILSSCLVLLLYHYASLRSGHSKAAFVACVLILAAIAPFFTLRPQLFGYLFLLLTLIALERFRQGRRKALWFLPLLFLLWVNTHGTFVFGLAVLALAWAGGLPRFESKAVAVRQWTPAERRELLTVLLLCVLVLPLTPYGTRLAAYPLEFGLSQPVNLANIDEWQPLGFQLYLGKYLLILLLLFFLAHALLRPRYRLEELLLLVLGVFAACVHVRLTMFFLLVFTPMLAVMLARGVPAYQPHKDRWAWNAILIGACAVAAVVYFPSAAALAEKAAERYPARALDFLQDHPVAGNMLSEYGWGGYLIWARGPQQKVFVDGRTDIYEYGGVLNDYLHISYLEADALALLRKYDIRACLLQRKAPLATTLRALPDWKVVYSDRLATVIVRSAPDPQTP